MGGGGVIRVVFHDEVARSPVQLIEGLHGLPYNFVDRINGRMREVQLFSTMTDILVQGHFVIGVQPDQ